MFSFLQTQGFGNTKWFLTMFGNQTRCPEKMFHLTHLKLNYWLWTLPEKKGIDCELGIKIYIIYMHDTIIYNYKLNVCI